MKRLTERFMHGLGVKDCYDSCSVCDVAVCCGLLEDILEKLAHYEDLEEQLEKLYGGKMPLDEVVENLNRIVQNGEEKLDYARILTNAEAEKWDKWKDIEKQGRLIELPCKLKNVIDVIFSHNEIVTLMCDGVDENGTRCYLHFWHGMAWNIPKEYLELQFVKIHGVVSDKPDTLYVEVDAKFTPEAAEAKLKEMEGAE